MILIFNCVKIEFHSLTFVKWDVSLFSTQSAALISNCSFLLQQHLTLDALGYVRAVRVEFVVHKVALRQVSV